jgi:excisionase family DNA binding protein
MATDSVNITTREVAEIARVDSSTVRKWAEAGTIPWAMKTPGGHYRFNRNDVLAALQMTPAGVS